MSAALCCRKSRWLFRQPEKKTGGDLPSVLGIENTLSKRYWEKCGYFRKSNGNERRGKGDAVIRLSHRMASHKSRSSVHRPFRSRQPRAQPQIQELFQLQNHRIHHYYLTHLKVSESRFLYFLCYLCFQSYFHSDYFHLNHFPVLLARLHTAQIHHQEVPCLHIQV